MIADCAKIGSISLYCGDARDILPELGLKADLVLSDPPYSVTSGGRGGSMGGMLSPKTYDNSGRFFPLVPWSQQADLIEANMAESSRAIIMTSDKQMGLARNAYEDAGLKFHRLLIWNKGSAPASRVFMQPCEFGLYLYKGRFRSLLNCGASALQSLPRCKVSSQYLPVGTPHEKLKNHPTEKPVNLMKEWARLTTRPGELVLDPFMGSGSTLVAAAQLGLPAVGIEIDPVWFGVARKRVEAAVEVAA
ncbi:MAG: site-specific DNA-methyltransferase [Pseudomonadota bacterium]